MIYTVFCDHLHVGLVASPRFPDFRTTMRGGRLFCLSLSSSSLVAIVWSHANRGMRRYYYRNHHYCRHRHYIITFAIIIVIILFPRDLPSNWSVGGGGGDVDDKLLLFEGSAAARNVYIIIKI